MYDEKDTRGNTKDLGFLPPTMTGEGGRITATGAM